MTIYYVNPLTGSDASTGLSWGAAWKSLHGLRESDVVLVAGDEVRIAKNDLPPAEYVDTIGSYEYEYNTVTWEDRGTLYGTTNGSDYNFQRYIKQVGNGTMGMLKPSMTGTAAGSRATAPSGSPGYARQAVVYTSLDGAFNAASMQVCGSSYSISASNLTLYSGPVTLWMRVHTPYTGTGDVDMPAGALRLEIRNGTTVIAHALLNKPLRNNGEWTQFVFTFTRVNTTLAANQIWLVRTDVPLTRGPEPFAIEITEPVLSYDGWYAPLAGMAAVLTRPPLSTAYYYASGDATASCITDFSFWLNAMGGLVTMHCYDDNRTAINWPIPCRTPFDIEVAEEVARPGRDPAMRAVYDLNGSAGGTAANPVRITGGWDTTTNVQDDYSIFGAGLHLNGYTDNALIDLAWADHVVIERVSALFGFPRLITRAKNVTLDRTAWSMRPWLPALGETTTETNVTITNSRLGDDTLRCLGRMGDLTLINTQAVTSHIDVPDPNNELGNLTMHNSFFAPGTGSPEDGLPIRLRGNVESTQGLLISAPKYISIAPGHTMRFSDLKTVPTNAYGYLVRTAADSIWDDMIYAGSVVSLYRFAESQSISIHPASLDARISLPLNTPVFATDALRGMNFPTAMLGNSATGECTDGASQFGLKAPAWTGSNMYGTMYLNVSSTLTSTSQSVFPTATIWGLLHMPPQQPQLEGSASTLTPSTSPNITACGGALLMVANVTGIAMRKHLPLYLLVNANSSNTLEDIHRYSMTVRVWYCGRPGRYRVHLGAFPHSTFGSAIRWSYEPYSVSTVGGTAGMHVRSTVLVGPERDVSETTLEYVGGWVDLFQEFEISGPGVVELRVLANRNRLLIDTLEIYELT